MNTPRTLDLDTLILYAAAHQPDDGQMCLLEAVAYIAGEPWSDHPECVCPVLAAFGRAWNDALPDDQRTRLLRPFIPKLIGTRSTPDVQDARAFMAADWAVRTFTPVWLRAAGLEAEAAQLEALPALSSVTLCEAAMPTIDTAGDAAWSAAGSAAWSAAWSAAGSAAGSAARSAARNAAGSAAWSAAGSAARSAAGDAAQSAAWNAAWSAAWNAARSAAWNAAQSAARSALRSHVELLQTSAVDLYERMIAVGDADA